MKKARAYSEAEPTEMYVPATSPEARENQMIALAIDEAERQMREHTASPLIITHYLKLGSIKGQIEKEILERERELVTAKTDSLKASQKSEAFYNEVLSAMSSYGSGCFNNQAEDIEDE